MSADSGPQSSGTWYMRGIRPTEQPQAVHAAQPSGGGVFAALCDSQPVATVPGRFDADEEGACAGCCARAAQAAGAGQGTAG